MRAFLVCLNLFKKSSAADASECVGRWENVEKRGIIIYLQSWKQCQRM